MSAFGAAQPRDQTSRWAQEGGEPPRCELDCRKTLEAGMAQFIPIVIGFVVCIAAALILALSSKSSEPGA